MMKDFIKQIGIGDPSDSTQELLEQYFNCNYLVNQVLLLNTPFIGSCNGKKSEYYLSKTEVYEKNNEEEMDRERIYTSQYR